MHDIWCYFGRVTKYVATVCVIVADANDTRGGAQGASVTHTAQDTSDTVPPIITLFEGRGYQKYKKGTSVPAEFYTVYDQYDGDVSESAQITGGLNLHDDVSSVKIYCKDAAGNSAIAYATCNCITCYAEDVTALKPEQQKDMLYMTRVDDDQQADTRRGYTSMEQEDGRVVMVNSRKAGIALKKYQALSKHNQCYCKCKESLARHGGGIATATYPIEILAPPCNGSTVSFLWLFLVWR
ncbi:hypothetical protein CYMTET_43826 [Cymbomonas tetramitiformis]|uniref:Uncharacterized protein n=1 Tax=Cymbomonas tetramitiformis TaxID=36881 RepID=A0AAE0C1D0_9CHLO|nr:hypothetical protein CYMTET_43826 [Cymbomonas tetramitiformis]